MIISSSLTIGQITFALRVAIQLLTYIGLSIIFKLILSHAPRVASLTTHDTLNRIVGANSATFSTVKWLFNSLRRKSADTPVPRNLILILFLSLSYTICVSVSDIGFLGFKACSVPQPTTFQRIVSLASTSNAEDFVSSNTINGTDLADVRTYRCDASAVAQFELGRTFYNCTSWHNGTLAVKDFYDNLNRTDTDSLMPRQLTHYQFSNETFFNYNTFNVGPTPQLVREPIIDGGLVIVPHAMGVRMVAGAPQLEASTKVDLSQALSLEVDVACMSLGVVAVKDTHDNIGDGWDFMSVDDGWRMYAGPDDMQDVLSKTVDDIRVYLQPFFNFSEYDEASGMVKGINSTNVHLSPAANVNSHRLPKRNSSALGPDGEFMANCSAALQQKLGIPQAVRSPGTLCSLLGIGGTRGEDGWLSQGFERMVCAAATQVNLVDATVQVDVYKRVSLNITRQPSRLNYVYADFWTTTTRTDNGSILFDPRTPYERYTLTPDPKSPTTHYIPQMSAPSSTSGGQGSAGNAISSIVPVILGNEFFNDISYARITSFREGFEYVDTEIERLVAWVGQVGGSYILGSLAYNGWAALDASPITVTSTGGVTGSCYVPYYGIGFVPLILSAGIILCWAVFLLIEGSLFGTGGVKDAYGGMATYSANICPSTEPSDTLVAWESVPEPRLRPLPDGYPLVASSNRLAISYLKAAPRKS